MALTILRNRVTNLKETTVTSGRNGNVMTAHVSVFRLNNIPVSIKSLKFDSLNEGDEITAVGIMKNGTFKVQCFRNETTGSYQLASPLFTLILGICLTGLGFLTLILIVGLFLLPAGIYCIYEASVAYSANKMLNSAYNSPSANFGS